MHLTKNNNTELNVTCNHKSREFLSVCGVEV